MDLTILGSGGPVPHPARGGSSAVVSVGGDHLLVDCGPGTVEGLLDADVHPARVEHLFITHHHMDHNAAFFHFAVSSWMLGRSALTLVGPEGTGRLVEALESVYEEDLEYRASLGRSLTGIDDIEVRPVESDSEWTGDGWRVTGMPVEHAVETYAYRFDEAATGSSVVFSGDTRKVSSLAEFASGADVLVHESPFGPRRELESDEPIWHEFVDPTREGAFDEGLSEVHSDATDAGEVAAAADIDTLVLDHLSPYVDPQGVREAAEAVFDGTVIPAADGLRIRGPL